MQVDQDSPGISFPPPFIFLGVLALGLMIDRVSWWPMRLPLGNWLEDRLGWIAVIAGAVIILTALGLFKRAGTDSKPWKASSALVTSGVYRWTRNPMYLGMALIYAGIAICADSVITLLLLVPVVVVIQRDVILREEAYMESRFGAEYLAYCARVRRWF